MFPPVGLGPLAVFIEAGPLFGVVDQIEEGGTDGEQCVAAEGDDAPAGHRAGGLVPRLCGLFRVFVDEPEPPGGGHDQEHLELFESCKICHVGGRFKMKIVV